MRTRDGLGYARLFWMIVFGVILLFGIFRVLTYNPAVEPKYGGISWISGWA
jgi:hypothetical protein